MRSEPATATSRDRTQGCASLSADLPPASLSCQQARGVGPPFSQSGVPCSFFARATVSCELRPDCCTHVVYNVVCWPASSRITAIPDPKESPRDSGQLQPANHRVRCFVHALAAAASAATVNHTDRQRSVMLRGNLDIPWSGHSGKLGIARRGLFSLHQLGAHRFEIPSRILSVSPRTLLTRGGSPVQQQAAR